MKLLKIIICSSLLFLPLSSLTSQEILQRLTLDEKIGQLFVIPAVSSTELNQEFINHAPYIMDAEYVKKMITEYHVGGIILLGAGYMQEQFDLTKKFQQLSNIPLLICQDCEWGLSMRLKDGFRFPRNMALGALSPENDNLIYQMGYEIGKQCRVLGIHMNLAPVIDVNNNPKNPIINDRSFGQDKESVARKAEQYMRGLQDAGVIPCAKHFPGHGDTDIDSHYGLPRINHTRERLDTIELYPFKKLIDAGIPAIMTAHLQIDALDDAPNLPSSLSHNVVTKLLKMELDFNGVIITDGLGMIGVTKHHELGELELKALLAGTDILLCAVDVPKSFATIKQAMLDGRFTEKELDEKVLKILQLKSWANVAHIPEHLDKEQLYSDSAKKLKQKLYAHALTIARDDEHLIKHLQEQKDRLTVIEIGQQDSSFLQEVQKNIDIYSYYLSKDADDLTIQKLINQLPNNKIIIIALLGMNRFAKQQFGISQSTQNFLQMLQQSGKKTIIIVFGNAYSLPLLENTISVIVAYEDDVDAQKAAAQLLASKFQVKGILPVSV